MALTKNIIIFVFLAMIVCEKLNGETYKVGDSAGWTTVGNVDYKTWASTKTFNVGDKILFEYNKEYHNVVRVTHKNFNLCNATAPYGTMDTGNDTFEIKKPGHFYFICGVPGHCEAGQKVDIRILSAPAPAPNEAWSPSPYGPAPGPSSSGSFSSSKGLPKSNLGFSVLLVLASVAYGIGR